MKTSSLLLLLAASTQCLFSTALTSPSSFSIIRSRLSAIRGGSETNMAPEAEADTPDDTNTTQTTESRLGPNAPPPGFLRRTLPNFPWHALPNYLTYMRCAAIPALIVMFYRPDFHVTTSFVFGFAAFTDWLDGYFARRWDITSPFGAFLDPVADKLMVATALVLLAGRYGAAVAVPTAIILCRELAVSALREWMAQRGSRDSVKVGFQGKVKTAATMLALTILLLVPYDSEESVVWMMNLYQPGMALLYLSTVVTVTSGSVYFRAAAPVLMGK